MVMTEANTQVATPAADAARSRALVFPGQGSQAVGMGQDLAAAFPAAREVFNEVDDALGQNLSGLMADGPENELILTENAQPALMSVSMAVLRVLEKEFGLGVTALSSYVAGHSLGEYSALTAAGSFTIGDAARLLRIRGRAMQTAVPVDEGAMAALIGLDLDVAHDLATEATHDTYDGAVCVTANDNAPGQVVVSGTKAAVERALEIAALRGARRSVLLPVSAPFHCPLMAPAADVMAEALQNVSIRPPVVPLISNVTAEKVTRPEDIHALLVKQLTGMVRWRESVMCLRANGIEALVEVGAGKVLTGLAKRIDRSLSAVSVGTPAEIEGLVASV